MSEQVGHAESVYDKAQVDKDASPVAPLVEKEIPGASVVEISGKEKITPEQLADWEIQKKQLLESVKRMNMITHFETLNALKDVVGDDRTSQHVRNMGNHVLSVGDALKAALFGDEPQHPSEETFSLNASTNVQTEEKPVNELANHDDKKIGSGTLNDMSGDQVFRNVENGVSHLVQHNEIICNKQITSNMKKEDLHVQVLECGIQEEDLMKTIHEMFEARKEKEMRPLPVFLKGKEVDLFKLYIQVRVYGGYDKVTAKGNWPSISKSIGFGQQCGALLKLVYVKYLKVIEGSILVASQPVINMQGEDAADIALTVPDKKREHPSSHEDVGTNLVAYDGAFAPEETKEFSVMLLWMKRMALNPCDPRKGLGPKVLKKFEDVDRCEMLARKCRAAFWNNDEIDSLGHPSSSSMRHKKRKVLHGDGSSEKDL